MQLFRSKISSKGQIVIPAELRRKLKLKQGAQVVITEEQGQLRVSPENWDEILALRGICKGMGLWEELRKFKREEREREDRER